MNYCDIFRKIHHLFKLVIFSWKLPRALRRQSVREACTKRARRPVYAAEATQTRLRMDPVTTPW